jgi:hypothetical protein
MPGYMGGPAGVGHLQSHWDFRKAKVALNLGTILTGCFFHLEKIPNVVKSNNIPQDLDILQRSLFTTSPEVSFYPLEAVAGPANGIDDE